MLFVFPASQRETGGVCPQRLIACQIAMAASFLLVPLDNGTIETNLASMTDDFKFILDDHLVPLEIQARLSALGFKQTSTFAMVEDSAPAVRAFIKGDIGLTVEGNDLYRSQVSALLGAWNSC